MFQSSVVAFSHLY